MISFDLNGQHVEFSGDPDTPLLWVVRDFFKLKGSKFGCGAGLCGACTMHLDGSAIKTCVLPVAAVAQRQVTTIEGLSTESELHPLQTAWVAHNVPQCGYCQSGQIMAAAALLKDKPNASLEDIDSAMAGNICRCGCYPRIKSAIVDAGRQLTRVEKIRKAPIAYDAMSEEVGA